MRALAAALFAVLVCGALDPSRAQQTAGQEAAPTREQLQLQIDIMRDRLTAVDQAQQAADMELAKAYRDAKMREYQFAREQMDLNVQGYEAHRQASYVVLALVCVVVGAGIVFAGFQLWKSITVAGVQASNDLEISASNIRVTSSVVGVVVLTISLVFLFIYTKYVFPIERVDTPRTEAPVQTSAK